MSINPSPKNTPPSKHQSYLWHFGKCSTVQLASHCYPFHIRHLDTPCVPYNMGNCLHFSMVCSFTLLQGTSVAKAKEVFCPVPPLNGSYVSIRDWTLCTLHSEQLHPCFLFLSLSPHSPSPFLLLFCCLFLMVCSFINYIAAANFYDKSPKGSCPSSTLSSLCANKRDWPLCALQSGFFGGILKYTNKR